MPFAKGHRPSPPSAKGLGHPHHLGAAPPPRSGEALLPPPVDQGAASSCTGNSSAVAICAAMARAAGLPAGQYPEIPSRLFLYYNARAVLGEADRDDGAQISDIFGEAALLGYPPESAWAYSDAFDKVTAQPDWEAIRAAADQRYVKGAYRLLTEGGELLDDVKRAIAAGHPVVWGTSLDEAFENLQAGSIWPGVTGRDIGGHAMVLHKFEDDIFWTRSSWGEFWCEAGSARITAAAVMGGSDFWVPAVAPTYSGTV